MSVQFFMGPSRKRKGHALLSRLEPAAAIQFCISQLSVSICQLSVCICQLSVVRCRILRTRAYLPGVPCRAGEGVQRRSWPPRLDVGDGDPKLPGAGTAPGYGPPPRWGESNGCSMNDQGRVPPLANKNQLAIPLNSRPPAACRFYSAFRLQPSSTAPPTRTPGIGRRAGIWFKPPLNSTLQFSVCTGCEAKSAKRQFADGKVQSGKCKLKRTSTDFRPRTPID